MNTSKPIHLGRNISKLRELRSMKQEALAQALGVSQQAISNLENSRDIDDARLQDVAKALGISKEVIKQFKEEKLISILSNEFKENLRECVGTNFGSRMAIGGERQELVTPVLDDSSVPNNEVKEEQLLRMLSSTFNDNSTKSDNASSTYNFSVSIEPTSGSVDKLIQVFEKNKSLYEEKEQLYERLLTAEMEKSALLKKLLEQ